MREIKFRAMSMCKGEHWLYGEIRHYAKNPHTEKWTIYDPSTGIETDVEEMTIGQYTGLKDRNGKEIYEGDVVAMYNTTFNMKDIGVVVYNDENACFRLQVDKKAYTSHYSFYSCDTYNDGYCTVECKYEYEVIGNIYDNPELLKT